MLKDLFRINKWLYPGIRMKRWIFLLILSVIVLAVGFSGIIGSVVRNIKIESNINIDEFFYRLQRLKFLDVALITLGIGGVILAFRRASFSVLAYFAPNREKEFINLAYKRAKLKRGPRIAAIGGGTGMPNVLRGMKDYTLNLSAVVTVADDGGSSGRLRKDYSILPPGDLRNCLVAMADEETLLGKLFQYRFESGEDLSGHNFGNLFITAMTHVTGDFSLALKESSKVLAVHGQVLPVTLDNVALRAKLKDGRVIDGESNIPKAGGDVEKLSIVPGDCKPYDEAIKAIKEAEVVVIGPGSLYTSIIPNLLVPGIREALLSTKSAKIYISNIMTQHGETHGYKVSDHLKAIFAHAGGKVVDYVIANNAEPSEGLLKRYAAEQAFPVRADRDEVSKLGVKMIEGRLFKEGEYIRHDPEYLARMIMKLIII